MTTIDERRDGAATPRLTGRMPLAEQLPRVLAQDHVVRGYVELCEEVWSSVTGRIDDLEWFLDVGTAPIAFVRWLGGWLGVTVDPTLPEERQRALVRTAGATILWRGTRRRVEDLLAALTGGPVEVVDGGGIVAGDPTARTSQQVSVRLTTAGGLSEAQLLDVIRSEVPANAVVELRIDAGVVDAPSQAPDGDTVVAAPEPFGDEGFLPPMRGGDVEDW